MAEKETKILSSLEKAKLQAIISDVNFVNNNEANSYRCNNCSSIAIYHYIASCSHVLCGKCHGQYYNKHCPVINCKNTLIDKVTQKFKFEFGMYNLMVYCTFRRNGCDAVIELLNLVIHQCSCKFSTQNLLPRLWVASPLKKLEEEVISLKNKIKDILETNNQSRNSKEINDTIAAKLGEKLSEFKEDFVRNSDKNIKELEQNFAASIQLNIETEKRKLNEQIVKECNAIKNNLSKISQEQLTNEQKKLSDQMEKKIDDLKNNNLLFQKELQIGLDNLAIKGKEELIKEQKKLRKEMEQFNVTINEMGQKFNSLQQQLNEQADVYRLQNQEMCEYKPKSYEFSWSINNLGKIENKDVDGNIADFISNDCKCKISTKFYLFGGSYFVHTTCAPYEIESNAPKCFHKTTFYILDQSYREKFKHISRINECKFDDSDIQNYVSITSTSITKNYIKKDSIIIKIVIEPFLSDYKYSTCSQNGTIIWKIDNYSKRKQDDIDGVTRGTYSDYFLSSKEGYRMKIRLFFSGTDVINIYSLFVKGEFDNTLTDEFSHRTTFAIIDQSDKQKKTHFIKTEESDKTLNYNYVQFTSKELENSAYLKNDCMIVKVSVESI